MADTDALKAIAELNGAAWAGRYLVVRVAPDRVVAERGHR
jgi:hypothetical protein